MIKSADFEDLSPFKELLYQNLVDAIIETKRHFAEAGHRYDEPRLFAGHVRAKLRELLESLAQDHDFVVDVSPSGMFVIYYKHFAIRFLKAEDGLFPRLDTRSSALVSFINSNRSLYTHLELPGFEELGGNIAGLKVHVFAYYDTTHNKDFAWLKIACPRSVTSIGIDWDWDELVLMPGSISPTIQNSYSLSERPDLPYTLIDDDKPMQTKGLSEDNGDDISTEMG